MAARAAPVAGQRAALVAGHQARRAPRLLLPSHGVLRPGARADARRGSRRGDRAGQRARRSGSPAASRRSTIARSRAGSTRIEAGNLYVNRPITGAIVGRQPFGGWKASSVGPGRQGGRPELRAAARALAPGDAARRSTTTLCPSRSAALLERCLAELPDADARARSCARARRATRARGASTSAASTIRARSAASATPSATGRAAA